MAGGQLCTAGRGLHHLLAPVLSDLYDAEMGAGQHLVHVLVWLGMC